MRRRLATFAFVLALGLILPQVASAWTLTVATTGSGNGSVGGAGFDCDWDGVEKTGDCTEVYATTTTVGLIAIPAGTVASWAGCDLVTGNECLIVNQNVDRTVTVTFRRAYLLSAARAGTGSGTVTSSPAGISCGADCAETYAEGTTVTLTAAAAAGSTFTGWSGACTGTGACTLAMTAARTVTATFDAPTPTHTLAVETEGSGTVTSSPDGISCGADCGETYPSGTTVTLTAAAADGWRFGHWEGCQSSSGATCTASMTADRSVTAVFVDDAVDAEVRGASTRKAAGKRYLDVEIRTEETLDVKIELIRRGRVLQVKWVTFRIGMRTATMRIRSDIAGGDARVRVTLTDAAGNVERWSQPVRVPRPA
ncbi:MAG: hypothetical protein IT201_00835 [Thermoleophilia bacterium]|nr:hypothetical protein [Thermoleophilia bacterium]